MNKKIRYILIAIGIFLLIYSSIAWFLIDVSDFPDSFEFPIWNLVGISVDSEGNIYCGSMDYSRVQAYNSKGEFLWGKYIDGNLGTFRIKITENGLLYVATARNGKLYIFKKDGTVFSEFSNVGHYFLDIENNNEFQFYDDKNNTTYYIKPSLFSNLIIKKDSSGKESVIIKPPVYKWLFLMGSFRSWLFGMLGIIWLLIFGRKFLERVLYIMRFEFLKRKNSAKKNRI